MPPISDELWWLWRTDTPNRPPGLWGHVELVRSNKEWIKLIDTDDLVVASSESPRGAQHLIFLWRPT